MKIYQEFSASKISEQTDPSASAPESDPVIPLDDHAFWKYVHRDQFLENQRLNLANGFISQAEYDTLIGSMDKYAEVISK